MTLTQPLSRPIDLHCANRNHSLRLSLDSDQLSFPPSSILLCRPILLADIKADATIGFRREGTDLVCILPPNVSSLADIATAPNSSKP